MGGAVRDSSSRDLFTPADARVQLVVNYGLAALFWLVVSSVLARLVRHLR